MLPIPQRYFSLVQRCGILHQITLLPIPTGPRRGGNKLMDELPTWFTFLFYIFTMVQLNWSYFWEDVVFLLTRQLIVDYIPKYVLGIIIIQL